MTALDVIQSPAMTTGRCSKPPQVNCAGWCLWCGERGCQQLVCRRRHRVSVWRVCPDCEGCETRGSNAAAARAAWSRRLSPPAGRGCATRRKVTSEFVDFIEFWVYRRGQ